jgi:hypothetical protein
MNWSRTVGLLTATLGVGILIVSVVRSLPTTNAAAGIGVIHLPELLLGAALLAIGLLVAIIGGRRKERRG